MHFTFNSCTRSDLIKAGEASVRGTPIDSLRYNNEEVIRDYSCLVSLYLHYGMPVRAEYTLRKLVKMRAENPNFGPNHAETILFLGLLYRSLKSQHKFKKASQVRKRITRAGKIVLVNSCFNASLRSMDLDVTLTC